jgi:hypothetical protein
MHRDLNDFYIPPQLNSDSQEAKAVEGTLTSMPSMPSATQSS